MKSFKCSKCHNPIALGDDLTNASKTSRDILRNVVTTPRPRSISKAYPAAREIYLHRALADTAANVKESSGQFSAHHTRAPMGSKSAVQESFIMLDSEHKEDNTHIASAIGPTSQDFEQQRVLFDLMSRKSEVNHPMCGECTDLMIQNMNKKMIELNKDREIYSTYLNNLKRSLPTPEEHELAETELNDLKQQEKLALEELRTAEKERADVLAELAQLEKDSAALDAEERQFWQDRNVFAAEIAAFEQERDSINLRYDHDVKLLERLQKTNVYHDAFHISHEGNFGTINGLRLGRLPNRPVSWDEINAAWGMTLLLLQTMAEKVNYTFQGYRLQPMGSTSRIDKIEIVQGVEKVITLELFGTTEINPLKLFQTNSFDRAVVAFLECLNQLGQVVEKSSPSHHMPYRIVKDKIEDVCIRMSFNQDEAWTRALKLCLTQCKYILAVVQDLSRKQIPTDRTDGSVL